MNAAISPAAATIETASLWARTRAIVLDLLILSLIQGIINVAFGSEHITNAVIDPATTGGYSYYTSTTQVDGIWLWLAAIVYFSVLEGLFGQTAGKAVVGIRVTDLNGGRPSWAAIIVRNFLRIIDSFPGIYLLGALAVRFSPLHQRIGDRVAGTIVVPVQIAPRAARSEAERRRALGLVIGLIALFLVACAAFIYWGRPSIVLNNLAMEGQFPGGRVASYQAEAPQWHGDTVTYPVRYRLAASGESCTGHITLGWTGFINGWEQEGSESTCR